MIRQRALRPQTRWQGLSHRWLRQAWLTGQSVLERQPALQNPPTQAWPVGHCSLLKQGNWHSTCWKRNVPIRGNRAIEIRTNSLDLYHSSRRVRLCAAGYFRPRWRLFFGDGRRRWKLRVSRLLCCCCCCCGLPAMESEASLESCRSITYVSIAGQFCGAGGCDVGKLEPPALRVPASPRESFNGTPAVATGRADGSFALCYDCCSGS